MGRETERVEVPERRQVQSPDLGRRFREWFLLTGNRWLVFATVILGLLVFVGELLGAGVVAVTDSDALTRSLAALVGGNLTLITVVISINQLILSREFGTPAELQEEIEGMQEYRREAEATADIAISPTTPGEFFEFLVQALRDSAESLRDAVDREESASREFEEDVQRYTKTLVTESDRTEASIQEPATEAFDTLVAIMKIDFTRYLNAARRLRTVNEDSLSADATESLDELIEVIEFIGVFRQYLETLYLQRELALLSRRLFYLGLPAITLPLFAIWVYGQQGGTTVDGLALQVVVALSAVVAFAPLSYFFAYIVRIATITRRTAALMPFKSHTREMG